MRLARAAAVLALSAAYFLHVFRFPHDAMVTTGMGDWVDPYFINFLLEHWHHSVWTLTDPSSPPMYFPVRGTLGYSHALILYAPFYLALRAFLDPFQAYNATVFLVLVSGSVCLYAILRKFVGLRFVEAVVLTVFFFSSRNVVNGGLGVWSQRASVFLLPTILLIALTSARMPDGYLRLACAALSGLLLSLLFTQDFYTAQFALLILLLLFPGALLVSRQPLGQALRELRETAALANGIDQSRGLTRPGSSWLIVAVVSLVWSVAVLLHPIARTTIGPLRFSATDPTRPLLVGLVAGGWYFFWHIRRFRLALRQDASRIFFESAMNHRIADLWKRNKGYVLMFASGGLAGCLVFLWIYLAAYREHPAFPEEHLTNSLRPFDASSWSGPAAPYDSLRSFKLVLAAAILAWVPWFHVNKRVRLYCAWFLLVSTIVLLIPLRFDDFSIWKTVFAPFPALSVIRDPGRIIPLYELAAVCLTALLMSRVGATSLLRRSVVVLACLLLAIEWNPETVDFGRSPSVYDRWVKAPIDIDRSCQSFFIKGASQEYMSRSFHMWTLYNVDSMFISLDRAIPTLNGYSAWSPTGWGLANPQEPGYGNAVRQWIERHRLRDVCVLDIEERKMRPITRLD